MSPWEEIKDRLNIVDVLGDYVNVLQTGSTYKCLCPFHKDKNPSLVISQEKGLWHCFGCGAGGDIFKFVMDFENISKKEALEKLAKKAGVKLQNKNITEKEEFEQKKITTKYDDGLKYLNWVNEVFHKILKKLLVDRENSITKYCLERGLSQKIIDEFQLGYAPKGNFILNLAIKHDLELDLLIEVGILKKTESGEYKDRFVDRLMIPIFDRFGKVIGFTGRILPYDKSERPKYLNSPETDWFHKTQVWYGWHLHQKRIRQQKKAIVVEGNMDVISANKHGLSFTLASQGTSFTTNQIKLLCQLTKTIWLAFDNDNAGLISGKKFFKQATQKGLDVHKLIIPKNFKDLDDYLTATQTPESDIKHMPYIDFYLTEIENELKSSDLTIQRASINDCLDLIFCGDNLFQEHYLQKLSSLTKKSLNSLKSEGQKFQKNNQNTSNIEIIEDSHLKYTNEQENRAYTAFQELVSKSSENNFQDYLNSIYRLLQSSLQYILLEEKNLSQYIDQNKQILEIIFQNSKNDTTQNLIILKYFFNQNYNLFASNEQLILDYLKVQQL